MDARITIEPGKRSGQPCVRGLRITAWDILSWLAAGMSEKEILEDYPELEPEDFRAVYDFAARLGRRVALCFHSICLSRIATLLMLMLLMAMGLGTALAFRMSHTDYRRPWVQLGVFIAVSCLVAFFVAAFGDAWDNVKHQFLFNLLLDTLLIFSAALVTEFMCARNRKRQMPVAGVSIQDQSA